MLPEQDVKIEGISALEYEVPEDGANINKKINVCTCARLSEEVAKGAEGCTRAMADDPDTLDLSNCTTADWGCYDGLQDISVVSLCSVWT